MRVIDFQDSLYRQQPTEKVQSRLINQPHDDAYLAQLKKAQEDAIRTQIAEETKEAREKRIEREKHEKESSKKKEKRDQPDEQPLADPKKRRPPRGGSLIDIDA
jgi:hypothetical protein